MSEVKEKEKKGLIAESLHRNNKEIRADRAEDLKEELEVAFKRECEDYERDIKSLERARKNMYDFSPTNTQSLVLVKDVIGHDVVKEDRKRTLEIREKKIVFEEMSRRYIELFGKPFNS